MLMGSLKMFRLHERLTARNKRIFKIRFLELVKELPEQLIGTSGFTSFNKLRDERRYNFTVVCYYGECFAIITEHDLRNRLG